MSKRVLWALLLIGVCVVILIMNTRGSVSITLFPGTAVSFSKAIALLLFTTLGVVIGALVK